MKSNKKIGRNDLCPCGSGKKYKKCCLIQQKPSLPIRPQQHVLDTKAINFIQGQLPSEWTCEEVSKDYGKDLRIEIFEAHSVVGHVAINQEFVIQSKGHERFTIVHTDKIAQPLKVSILQYLDIGLLPSLIVAYSDEEKKACYLWLKPYIAQVLDRQDPDWRNTAGDSEITIHIPLNNTFDKLSFKALQQHVSNYHNQLLKQNFNPHLVQKPAINIPKTTPYQLRHPQITDCLNRPHLTKKLHEILSNCHIFLHAGAGYGKTWLIHDLVTTYKFSQVVWFTFDQTMLGGTQLIRLLAIELYKQTQSTGKLTLAYLEQMSHEAHLNQATAIFHDELQQINSDVLLILEDFHFVSDEEVNFVISRLLSEKSKNVQIIITSRHPLPIKQAKLKAQGLLTAITQDEMAFSLNETQSYFMNSWRISLPDEQLLVLHDRIGEWVAALGLAANALDEKDSDKIERLLNRLNGYDGNIYEFFAEEVYSELTEPEKHLLRRLALVKLISPDLVTLFTNEQNGGAVLRKLHSHSTFLIRDDSNTYKLHSLFAEFLEAKFLDEEGIISIENTHKSLAQYFYDKNDWYAVTEHASKGKEYNLAIDGLIQIAPASIDLGFGSLFLKFTESIPEEYLEESSSLQEIIGRAALQTGQLERAMAAFSKAITLYENLNDINRIEFFLAEMKLDIGKLSPQEFVTTAKSVATNSYAQHEYFFGYQAELRAIETAQTLTVHEADANRNKVLQDLIQEADKLIEQLEVLGQEYNLIKSKAYTTKAHLILQKITTKLREESGKYRLRNELGHPVSSEQKNQALQEIAIDLQTFLELHQAAGKLIGDRNEIQLAFTRLRFIDDRLMLDNMFKLSFLVSGSNSTSYTQSTQLTGIEARMRQKFLPWLDECRRIFAQNHILEGLAHVYLVAAEIYDSLGELENRNKMAETAHTIAAEYGFTGLTNRAEKILQGQHTFSWVMGQANELDEQDDYKRSKTIANWSDEYKRKYVDLYLSRIFDNDLDEQRRKTVELSVDEMVIVAQQKLEWCQFLDLVEDREHENSPITMHQEIPNKYIICQKLEHRSPNSGKSFQDLWPLFRGVFCLGCSSKAPYEPKS